MIVSENTRVGRQQGLRQRIERRRSKCRKMKRRLMKNILSLGQQMTRGEISPLTKVQLIPQQAKKKGGVSQRATSSEHKKEAKQKKTCVADRAWEGKVNGTRAEG